ncbi:unnamed protein product [Dracunculus medinensis]|uniref:Rab-GAP TBC domain-containing protein n=1 Tax=Dracunculus medinensis TaxID=318479 RepID=A0A0N4U9K8_DRAME|nr:unnamed protein product [Dracunculus medinensis]
MSRITDGTSWLSLGSKSSPYNVIFNSLNRHIHPVSFHSPFPDLYLLYEEASNTQDVLTFMLWKLWIVASDSCIQYFLMAWKWLTFGDGERCILLLIALTKSGSIKSLANYGAIATQFVATCLQVYRQLYAPNPFASETDEDIQKYMKEVESKTPRPGSVSDNTTNGRTAASSPPPFETDSPSAETISLMQAARQHRSRMITAGASSIDEETALNTIPDMDNSHIGRLTLETTFDESDMPQSRIVCSTPVASIHSDRMCGGSWSTAV